MTQVMRKVRRALLDWWMADRRGAAGLAGAGMLVVMPALALGIDLSAIAAGTGGFAINGASASESSGATSAVVGDVNGDGRADVLVGAPNASPPAGAAAGRAYLVFGKTSTGLVEATSLTSGSGGGFVLNGAAANDKAGESVAGAGDFNNDGLADVIVGAPYADPVGGGAGDNRAGRAYLVYGKTDVGPVFLANVASNIGGFAMDGQSAGDNAGRAVSAGGDVNGDGLDDLIVGAPGRATNSGMVYVILGGKFTGPLQLSAIQAATGGFALRGFGNDGRAGASVSSAGDVNDDGYTDVIVGSPTADLPIGANAGRAYVVFGKTNRTLVELSAVAASMGGGYVINGQGADDYAGWTVAGAGDVNGDGRADVLVSAGRSDPGGVANAGRSYVVFGRTAVTPIELSDVEAGTGGFCMVGEASGDHAGHIVWPAGDTNGDGWADVIVSASVANGGFGASSGRCYMVLGRATPGVVALSQVAAGTGGFAMNGQAAGDVAGNSVAGGGDVNGDGVSDVVVGASGHDPVVGGSAQAGAGRTYVGFCDAGAMAAASTYITVVRAGDSWTQGIGVHRNGASFPVGSSSRACVDFDLGQGSGRLNSSTVTATITRNDAGIANFDPATLADVHWRVDTSRFNYGDWVRLTFQYRDAEIAGLNEADLHVYCAPTAAGPFTTPMGSLRDIAHNRFTADVTTLPMVFVLSTVAPVVPLNGDANNDGQIDVADVTTIHNQIAGITLPPLPGDGDVDNDGDVDAMDVKVVVEHLVDDKVLP